MTIGSFVCTKCSGMLRGITPPHRIKSMSMSSFSAEEVSFLKSRGNVWCSKVWMGLYDKGRSVAPDSKDEDALKYHIVQKYEKKSYYVDPSQIQQTLSSIASSNTSNVEAVSTAASSSFIGTTLTHRSNISRPSVPQAVASMPSPLSIGKPVSTTKPNGNIPNNISSNSSAMSGIVLPPPVVDPFSSNANFPAMTLSTKQAPAAASAASSRPPLPVPGPISVSSFGDAFATLSSRPTPTPAAPAIVSAHPVPAAVKATTTTTTTVTKNNINESFANFDAVQFDSAPADPWSATKSTEAKAAAPSANATAWPTMTTASGTPAGQPKPGPHGLSPMTPANPSATQKSPTGSGVSGSQTRAAETTAASVSVADRYSALKELDEIFKTTVTVSDGQSTGASIFGSSPLATQPAVVDPSPIMNTGSVFGPSPTNFSSPITTSSHLVVSQENNGFESTAFATAWGSEAVHQSQPFKPQMQVQAPAAAAVVANENRGFSPSWTPNWGPSAATVANNTNITISSVASNNSSASKAPINPFTGASNLTQLNTSPWPTTGTSPVQNNSTSAWPNIGSNNASSGIGPSATADATSVSGGPFPAATAAPPPQTTNSGFPGFSLNSSNTTTPVAFPVPNNDPFGAAPATNIQKTENNNNNDLFAKAPKPFGSEIVDNNSAINALTQEIFGNMRSSPSLSNGSGNVSSTNPMQQQQTGNGEGFNPWASPTPGLSPFPAASNSVVPPSISTDSIFSSATKPNTTNPFL